MNLNIATISAAATGGAGIAAYRLHSSLIKTVEINGHFIQSRDNLTSEQRKNNVIQEHVEYSFCDKINIRLHRDIDTINNNEISKYGGDAKYEVISFPQSYFKIEKDITLKNTDIVHLHWVSGFINYPSFFKHIKQPIVWTLHDMNPFMGIFHYEGDLKRNPSLSNLNDQIAQLKNKSVSSHPNIHVVCLSEWMKEKSEASNTLGRYPHYVIPNGLDMTHYPLLDKTTSKTKIGVDNNLPTVLFVAHQVDVLRKGFDLIQEMIPLLGDPKFNLISVGSGKIDIYNPNINYIPLGNINNESELNTIYSATDATIIPSREDNLPNVMLESMANGTPVISFANGGMKEHIQTGMNGILVKEISPEALALSITDFLSNKFTFDANRIRNYAIDTFSAEIQTKKYIDLYKSILLK